MGTAGEVQPVRGVDNADDQVKRCAAFAEKHPEVAITSPRQNGTGDFRANWVAGDGTPREASHDQLRWLLDWLEEAFR